MTSEDEVIEMLMEAEKLGIREEVIQYARHLREINIRMDRVAAFEVALSKLTQVLEDE